MIELEDDREIEGLYQVCECCHQIQYFWDTDFVDNEAIKFLDKESKAR